MRLVPSDIRVTRDGQSEPFEVLREGHGRYRNVKIGSADVTMDGEHVYVIRYHVDGVLAPHGDGSQFYWNLIPSGWQMQIEQSTLVVHLPAAGQDVRCAVGVGAQSGCAVSGVGTRTLTTTHRRAVAAHPGDAADQPRRAGARARPTSPGRSGSTPCSVPTSPRSSSWGCSPWSPPGWACGSGAADARARRRRSR